MILCEVMPQFKELRSKSNCIGTDLNSYRGQMRFYKDRVNDVVITKT